MKGEKLLPKKGSKITEKGTERYDSEFPDRETSYLIGSYSVPHCCADKLSMEL